MSCSYADIAMAYHDRKALSYFLSPTTWKRFRGWENQICYENSIPRKKFRISRSQN